MNNQQLEEFGTMKAEIKNIKTTVTNIDAKLDKVLDCKLDKKEFQAYRENQSNWYRWVPTLVTVAIALILLFRGI